MGDRCLGLIAGAGRFPLHIAREAKRQGVSVAAIGMRGWADPALAAHVGSYTELPVGQLGPLLRYLKAHGVREVILAGKVTKEVLLAQRAGFDWETARLLTKVRDFSVGSLLGALGDRLAQEGITLLDSSIFLRDHLCPVGVLTARAPSKAERADIDLGLRVAQQLAQLDIGQTVVVKQRVVVAVEALEGTDAAIRRAHALAGEGGVIVKAAAAGHDRRFDLPVVGTDTLATMRETRASCLAMQAGVTLLLDREELLAAADAAGLSLIGLEVREGRGPREPRPNPQHP